MARSIPVFWEFTYVQMKAPIFFQGEIIAQQPKYIDEILKKSLPESLVQFQPNFAQNILVWTEFKFV